MTPSRLITFSGRTTPATAAGQTSRMHGSFQICCLLLHTTQGTSGATLHCPSLPPAHTDVYKGVHLRQRRDRRPYRATEAVLAAPRHVARGRSRRYAVRLGSFSNLAQRLGTLACGHVLQSPARLRAGVATVSTDVRTVRRTGAMSRPTAPSTSAFFKRLCRLPLLQCTRRCPR